MTESRPASQVRRSKKSRFMPAAGDVLNHYEVIRRLGQGGMGTVFLARDTQLGRKVAIKFLVAATAEMKRRFIGEACTTAQCIHPNIIGIHEIGEHKGCPYMVLEYLKGSTLREVLKNGPLSPGRVVSLAIPIIRALACAHAMGIVHRDLKPENIMLTDTGVVKVLDFGIAKILQEPQAKVPLIPGSESTRKPSDPHEGLLGTLPYMAPEQLDAGPVDHRADLWALGIVLAEAVTGRHPLSPYSKRKLLEVSDLRKPMPPLVTLAPDVGKLGPIIDRCLAKPLHMRTENAAVLLDALQALVPHRPFQSGAQEARPFPGLGVFQESDADRFFGRDEDISSFVCRLRKTPLITLVGPSGVGKSSFLRAGVAAALKRSGERWWVEMIRPGLCPLTALAELLGRCASSKAGVDLEAVEDKLLREPGYFGKQLRATARRTGRRILVVVDPLEELFTLTTSASVREAFLRSLMNAADDPVSSLRVVFALRSDFLNCMMEDRHLAADLTPGLALLSPISSAGLRSVLEQSFQTVGYAYEDKYLLDRIAADLFAVPNPLLRLQFIGGQLWDLRDRKHHTVTCESYLRLGGVVDGLAHYADSVVSNLSDVHRGVARAIFEALVTPQRTAQPVKVSLLCTTIGNTEDVEETLDALVEARLLTIETPGDRDASIAELIHESLIESWPTLQRWLDEKQRVHAFLTRLGTAAQRWDAQNRNPALLWRNREAEEAVGWSEQHIAPRTDLERDYLDTVIQHHERALRHKRWVFRSALVALMLFAVTGWALQVLARSLPPEETNWVVRPSSTVKRNLPVGEPNGLMPRQRRVD